MPLQFKYSYKFSQYVVIVIGFLLSVLSWWFTYHHYEEKENLRLDLESNEIVILVQDRMAAYEQVLKSGVGFFNASDSVSRKEWAIFVKEHKLNENFKGIQGFGYSEVVLPQNKQQHEERIRQEGFPNYKIKPEGQRKFYTPVIYLEPFNERNKKVLGYDVFSEKVRKEALIKAMLSGEAAITGKVKLVQENDKNIQAGFLMYLPVYKKNSKIDSPQDRALAIKGFVSAPFRINDLMNGILGTIFPKIDFEIYDGDSLSKENILYNSNINNKSPLYKTTNITMNGHIWTLLFKANSALESENIFIVFLIPSFVLILTLLLYLLLNSLIKTKENALEIASKATRKLQISEERLRFSMEGSGDGLWDWNLKTNEVYFSKRWKEMLGFAEDEIESNLDEWKNRVHPEELEQVYVDITAHIEGKSDSYENEYRVKCKDGSYKWILDRGMIVSRDIDGSPIRMVGSHTDISMRKKMEKELREERSRFSLAIEGAQDGLWDWDLKTDEVLLTERFETMLDYSVGDLPQNIDTWFGLLHPDDKERVSKIVKEYLDSKGKKSYESTFRLRAKDGSWRWILGRGKAQFDAEGTPLRFVGFNADISEQMEYQDKLKHTAKHDSLTHLPNRFLLSELLTHAMHGVKRKNQRLALIFIDLDGFKTVNDTYGHEAGDKVLITISERMNNIVRDSDIVSRIGGDEFVIVASELKNSSEVIPLLQRLLSDLSSNILYENNNMRVSASIGVSFYPQADDIGNEILIRQADQAMYQAKLSGKNQYQFFNLEASLELKSQQQDLVNLREAIKKDEFALYYQPKVNMTNNQVVGFEALLRWNHPTDGLVYPDSFLPLVEHESSFMIDLGHWVLEHAFSQLEAWHLAGLDIMLSVNVSSHEVKQESFSSYLKELLAIHPAIKPNSVEIEILETSALENFELTSHTLSKCQDLGISIAIDDFGTGYASLHYLKKLPMNTLKIDKSFVIDLLTTSQNISIVEASIGLAHAFNSHAVAEGVESEEHGKVLLQLGCEIAQGYVISKAMPAQDVESWMKSWKGFTSWQATKPTNADGRAIMHAAMEHNNWINSIEAFLQDKTSELPELGSSHCYLGNWISHSATKEQRNHPEFEELNKIHSELHDYAEKLLRSSEQDKAQGIEKLRELRKKVLVKLEVLASEISKVI